MESARNGSICRHFLKGTCRFGPRCIFRHEAPHMPPSQICRYFQKGSCWYGDRCRYLHVLLPNMDPTSTSRRSSEPAVSFGAAVTASLERRGIRRPLPQNAAPTQESNTSGSTSTLSNNQPIRHLSENITEEQTQEPGSAFVRSSEVSQASASHGRTKVKESSQEPLSGAAGASSDQSEVEDIEAVLQSKDMTCGICMEKVYDRTDAKDRVFGILPNCNHSFCLQCILTWRKTKGFGSDVVRACPQCRVKSAFYVPNKYWVEGQAKENVISAFKKKCSKKRCFFYDRYGYCPFKTECLYQHVKKSNPLPFLYMSDDEDDDGQDLLSLFIMMSLLGADEDSDDDLSFYMDGEFGF
ncbi:putative E3 ubiquitin-protein ligase makorin-2 [Oryzias melastigma]|uniref:RING-type E3 ubiquitin transferase n=1 Tax=Oryzias melastigma TaxID=30732 RepID=A0A834C2X4_ORYME|nr:putative E3 ubiquitin-protein ligase makorin-2 [Oryzias melastigma]